MEKIAAGTRKAGALSNREPNGSENMILFQETKAVDQIGQVNRSRDNCRMETGFPGSFRQCGSTAYGANPRNHWAFLCRAQAQRRLYRKELAEREGFEPSVPVKGTTVFETAPIDRSGTSPDHAPESTSASGRRRSYTDHLRPPQWSRHTNRHSPA